MKTKKWNAIAEDFALPVAGDKVMAEDWPYAVKLETSDWESSQFYLTTPRNENTLAVNIKVTGRTYQWPFGSGSPRCVRVQIEFVGDGEPSHFVGGWFITRDW